MFCLLLWACLLFIGDVVQDSGTVKIYGFFMLTLLSHISLFFSRNTIFCSSSRSIILCLCGYQSTSSILLLHLGHFRGLGSSSNHPMLPMLMV